MTVEERVSALEKYVLRHELLHSVTDLIRFVVFAYFSSLLGLRFLVYVFLGLALLVSTYLMSGTHRRILKSLRYEILMELEKKNDT